MHGSKHLSTAEIAILVDGNPEGAVPDKRRDHLAMCPECYAAYAEAVRDRLAHAAGDETAVAPEDWIAAATALGTDAHDRERGRRLAFPRLRPALIGVASVAAMIALVVWLWPGAPSGSRAETELVAALMASSQAGMILPGGEGAADVQHPVYRGETAPASAALSAAIDDATSAYLTAGSSVDLAVQVIGAEIAIGQIGNAQVMLEHARRRFPADQRLILLEAVIAYRQSDLAQAEELLRQVVAIDSECAAALFNLGFLLSELDRAAEARPYLERARTAGRNTLLAARAERLLAEDR